MSLSTEKNSSVLIKKEKPEIDISGFSFNVTYHKNLND
ncbi:hypothetical protein KKH3_03910 [Pectobacterium actinidiae]|nr:hypothetical protein KKH3_03910 [Pectobacterium actinidiae]